MTRTWLPPLAFPPMIALSLAGCSGPEKLYLSAKKDALVKTLDIEKNQMVQKFIYNGTDLNFDYSLEREAEVDQVGFQLLLATREATSVRVSASLVQSGSVSILGSQVLEVKGNQGEETRRSHQGPEAESNAPRRPEVHHLEHRLQRARAVPHTNRQGRFVHHGPTRSDEVRPGPEAPAVGGPRCGARRPASSRRRS